MKPLNADDVLLDLRHELVTVLAHIRAGRSEKVPPSAYERLLEARIDALERGAVELRAKL